MSVKANIKLFLKKLNYNAQIKTFISYSYISVTARHLLLKSKYKMFLLGFKIIITKLLIKPCVENVPTSKKKCCCFS